MSEFLDRMAGLSEKKRALLALRFQKAGIESLGIPRRKDDGQPPAVSFAQQRLWFLDQYAPGNPVYNIPYGMRLQGRLDVVALERALNEIISRHEVLRTTLTTIDDDPVQIITPFLWTPLAVADLEALPAAAREAETERQVDSDAMRPFDLQQGPLFRAGLLRLAATDHMLLMTMHHVISDGWSVAVLTRELSELYAAFAAGRPSPLQPLPIQYADFSVWQRQWLSGKVLDEQLAYWKKQLGGDLAALELPTDRPRPPVQTFRGDDLAWHMPRRLATDLKALGRSHGVTLYMTLLAAYKVVLHRHSGQRDIVVGTSISGRNRAELEPLIGFFINMLVLRSNLEGDPPFRELLKQVRETTLGAYAHQDLPFEKLVNTLRPERDASRTPLFQTVLLLQNAPVESPAFPGLEVSFPDYKGGVSRFDAAVVLVETEGGLEVSVEYATDLFDATTVARMMTHYETLLEAVAAAPESRLSELQLMSEAQRAQMLREWNDSGREFASATIPELFAAQVGRTPEGVAATFGGGALSYGELDRRSGALGRHLRALGAVPEMLVGLCVERSLEMVVAVMGILKSGAAYLPLDPTYPPQRLAYMLADAQASLLVTQERLLPALPQTAAATVCVDREQRWRTVDGGAAAPPPVPANLAYAIYTSGSTGQPKGVLIAHRSVANFISSVRSIFVLRPGERVLQFASICFDVSVFETFSALLSGATLCLSDRETLLSPELLSALLLDQKVTVTDMPPAMMALLDSRQLAALRIVFVGGEKFSGDLVKSWALPGRRFFNGYGPTESTVTMTLKDCPPGYDQSPPIGVPMPNHEMYVLDRHLNEVPVGAAAELVINGEGLTRGYHRRPRLTAEKLVPHPFTDRPGSRLYRTGDLVRFLAGGDVDFLGRVDDQVKLRGLRIELGEIEQVLSEHPAVTQVVVMVREDQAGQKRLVAYLLVESERPNVSELRNHLGERLPSYMIPSAFLLLDELPTSPSGKVDRQRLPVPEAARPELDQAFVTPRTATEKTLAEQAFAPVLGVEEIGVDDNFFELGGSSLQATQLVARIRRAFGVRIPLSTLFASPTVARLALVIDQALGKEETATPEPQLRAPLVAIQPRGSRPPFFCVHPISGTVFCYSDLARLLGEEQPFYGFQAPGLEDDEVPAGRIDVMAAHYLKAMRGLQKTGPYLLGGWSMGGTVAFEMARQLRQAGEEVALLALMDVMVPTAGVSLPDDAELVTMFLRDMAGLLGREIELPEADQFRGLDEDRQVARVMALAGDGAGVLPADIDHDQVRRRLAVFKANVPAMWSYPPQPYDGSVTLWRAAESPDNSADWSQLVGAGVSCCHVVPGDHYTMMQVPQLETLAATLGAEIAAAVGEPVSA